MEGIDRYEYCFACELRQVAHGRQYQGKLKGGSLKETVYTPEAHLGFRWTTWREMAVGLVSSRGLTWRLFVRQISARYRQSVLGYFWALLPAMS